MEQNLICMMGLPRSGKSTYVDRHFSNYQIVCPDDIRLALGVEFEERLENFVWGVANTSIRAHLIRGLNTVVDATNTTEHSIKRYKAMADEYGFNFKIVFINTSLKVCLRRNAEGGNIPAMVIERMKIRLDILKDNLDSYDVKNVS